MMKWVKWCLACAVGATGGIGGVFCHADEPGAPSVAAYRSYANAKPPMTAAGAVNVNAHVPESVQVPQDPAAGGPNDVPQSLAIRWSDYILAQPDLKAKAFLLMDAETGDILASKNANERLAPASITKLMLMYVAEGELASGRIKLDDKVTVPKEAWATGGSRMFLKPGQVVSVRDLISGIIVDSGNDAAVTMANYVAGTQNEFTAMMNQAAGQLKMDNTHFTDVMGLPAPAHFSTAYDLSKLGRAVVNTYPQYYHFFGQKWFSFNGVKQPNFNRLLFNYAYADGMKTGSTNAAGYSLVGSAQLPSGMRLISVVLGTRSDNEVAAQSKSLLSYGFRYFEERKLYEAGKVLGEEKVWQGKENQVSVGLEHPLVVVLPRGVNRQLKATMALNNAVKAPIQKGDTVGEVNVMLGKKVVASAPVVAMKSVAQGNALKQLTDRVKMWANQWV